MSQRRLRQMLLDGVVSQSDAELDDNFPERSCCTEQLYSLSYDCQYPHPLGMPRTCKGRFMFSG